GLLPEPDARALTEAHELFTGIFQWQRLAIAGAFEAAAVPPAILQRLAAVAGLPDAKVLLQHLNETRARVREIFSRTLQGLQTSPEGRGRVAPEGRTRRGEGSPERS
ncbi:MAG TPA: hypothetical protein VKA80_03685, partial [Beijerinckiaceae bacterium]|nr:hypothetical protein [Beijerinckiaceae bacterium]